MKPHPECPKIEPDLTAYLTGDLPAARASAIRDHLARCEGCRASAQELATTLDLLRGALAASPAVPERLDPARRAAILAARPSRTTIWLDAWLVPLARAAIFIVVPALILGALIMPSMQYAGGAARSVDLARLEAETAAADPFAAPAETSARQLEADTPADPLATIIMGAPAGGTRRGGEGAKTADYYFTDPQAAGEGRAAGAPPVAAPTPAAPAEMPVLGDMPVVGRLMRGAAAASTPVPMPASAAPARPAAPPAPTVVAAPAKAAPESGGVDYKYKEGEELKREIPKPMFVGTPVGAKVPNLEPPGTPQPKMIIGEPKQNVAGTDAAKTRLSLEEKAKDTSAGWFESSRGDKSAAGVPGLQAAGKPPAGPGAGMLAVDGNGRYDARASGGSGATPAAEPALAKAGAGTLALDGGTLYSGGTVVSSGSALREKGQSSAANAPVEAAGERMATTLYPVQPSIAEIVTTRDTVANRGEFVTMGGSAGYGGGGAADASEFGRQVEAAREAGTRARRALAEGKAKAGEALDFSGVVAGQKPAAAAAMDDTVAGLGVARAGDADGRDRNVALRYQYAAQDKKEQDVERWDVTDSRRGNRAPVDELRRKSDMEGFDTDGDGAAAKSPQPVAVNGVLSVRSASGRESTPAPDGTVHAGMIAGAFVAQPESKPQSELAGLAMAGKDVATVAATSEDQVNRNSVLSRMYPITISGVVHDPEEGSARREKRREDIQKNMKETLETMLGEKLPENSSIVVNENLEQMMVRADAETLRRIENAAGVGPVPPVAVPQSKDVAVLADMEKKLEKAPQEPAGQSAAPTFKPAGFNPVVEAVENAFSTFSIDVDTASYTMARRSILDGKRPEPESVRTEEFVNAFDYDYAPPARGAFAIHVDGAPSPFRTSMDVLRIGIKGRRIGRDQHVPSNLTLVIDTSGSMQTDDRIGLIRRSLRMLVDQLDPEDRVAVVQFGSKAALRLEPTPVAQKEQILKVIDSMETVGSTQLEGGLKLGYEVAAKAFRSGASNRVILMSDGVANLGATEAAAILATVEAHRKQGVRLTVLGFGTGAYDDAMLESLADKGDGAYTFIDSAEEAKRVLVDNLAATLHVIASDVKIQVEFNPRRVQRWRQLGYENRALTKEQFRDDTVDAGEVGSGQSVTALYDVQLDGAASEWIGTVRVRYRDIETGRVEEIERRITARDFTRDFAAATPRFRLAAGVAEFAELLRLSPHTFSQGRDLGDALGVLRPVAMELSIDPQVQELVRLAQAAQGLPY